jgi:hypothetical protein
VKTLIAKEYHEIMDEAFLRENLLKAHANGEEKVIRMVPQHHSDGRKVLMCIEDYFMTSEVSKDVFMVCFFQEIDAEEYEVNAVKERKEV